MKKILTIIMLAFIVSNEAVSATIMDVANEMLSANQLAYIISNPDTGFSIVSDGKGQSDWVLSDNGDNTISAVATFSINGRSLILQDTFFYRYTYDFNSDVTIWGFFPTDSINPKDLLELIPFLEVPLIDSGYDINLEFFASCAAFCSDPYPEVSQVPVPAAVWLFTTGLLGLIGLARRKAHV